MCCSSSEADSCLACVIKFLTIAAYLDHLASCGMMSIFTFFPLFLMR